MFDSLSNRELAAIERILHKREYQPNEVIFRQDEPGMGMYIVESGTVRIVSEGRAVDMSEVLEGEVFGEISLLDEAPRSASAIAKTACTLFGFFQPDLFALIDRNPTLGVKIVIRLARIMGTRVRHANESMQLLVDEIQKLKTRAAERSE